MKRFLALLLAVPLVHLNVARADVACGKHATMKAAPETAADAAHAHHEMPAPDEECETPAQNECCEALASCGPAIGSLDAIVIVEQPIPGANSLTYVATLHASPIAAPEPPPPRA